MQTTRTYTGQRGHSCAGCIVLWLALGLIAYEWPLAIVWIGAGVVVALILFALSSNPVPNQRIDERHVHRPGGGI